MIQVNLLPGHKTKASGRGAQSRGLFPKLAEFASIDRYAIVSVAGILLASLALGWMVKSEKSQSHQLTLRLQTAIRDSAEFADVLAARSHAVAYKDSVIRQLNLIKSIDGMRYTWAHILDEVNTALPSYTWLSSIMQLSSADITGSPDSASSHELAPAYQGVVESSDQNVIVFRVTGQTVDVQALTQFMRALSVSPFLQDVQLERSDIVITGGKAVTEFQLAISSRKAEEEFLAMQTLSVAVMQ